MTATGTVEDVTTQADTRLGAALANIGAHLRSLTARDAPPAGPALTTTVRGADTVSTVPTEAVPSLPSPDKVAPLLPMSPGAPRSSEGKPN